MSETQGEFQNFITSGNKDLQTYLNAHI